MILGPFLRGIKHKAFGTGLTKHMAQELTTK